MSPTSALHDIAVIVPAAGQGTRMRDGQPKQYLPLNGVPMLQHVLSKMLALGPSRLVVAIASDDEAFAGLPVASRCRVVVGGSTRAESVRNCLDDLDLSADDWVMVHDAARPCIRARDISRLVQAVDSDPVGGILAVPVVETVKRSDDNSRIDVTVSREGLWLAQTPQMFRFGLLKDALDGAAREGVTVTDEASAIEWMGLAPLLVEGHRDNLKVTTPEDIKLAEQFLKLQG